MIKCVVFDFDGTLVDSKAVFVQLYNAIAQKRGYTLMDSDNIEYLRTLSIIERCTYLKVPLYKIPLIASKIIKQYEASVPLLQFNPGITEMLSQIYEKNIPYAILSSNSTRNISRFFKLKGVEVNDIFCSSNIFGKDRVLRKFLKAKNLTPSEIIYVGDEARDIIACRKLGIQVAWVSWGYDHVEALNHHLPDYIVNNPNELLHLLTHLPAL